MIWPTRSRERPNSLAISTSVMPRPRIAFILRARLKGFGRAMPIILTAIGIRVNRALDNGQGCPYDAVTPYITPTQGALLMTTRQVSFDPLNFGEDHSAALKARNAE